MASIDQLSNSFHPTLDDSAHFIVAVEKSTEVVVGIRLCSENAVVFVEPPGLETDSVSDFLVSNLVRHSAFSSPCSHRSMHDV